MQPIIKRRTPQLGLSFPPSLDPILAYLYQRRSLNTLDELSLTLSQLMDYQLLSGLDEAVPFLYEAIKEDKKIVIVGDFDTDGATSTALMVRALRGFGVRHVSYLIPNRFDEGYGLSPSVVDRARQVQADVIITVDNGISANEAIAYANQHQIAVIVTDHHLPPETLPDAKAIVNPQLPDCAFPSKHLAGVGVAFYFMIALRSYLRQQGWFEQQKMKEFNLAQLLDLVAIGTVADLVSLDHNNRILVQQGLARIRQNRTSVGIQALLQVAAKPYATLGTQDIAFYLAPRLNAAGRMENMSIGVELLLTEDLTQAFEIARLLDDLNGERKAVEAMMKHDALMLLKRFSFSEATLPNTLVVYDPDFHEGVIGILSSRLKDQFYRPVFSFARNEAGLLKGSGRSIPHLHLRDSLEIIQHRHPKIFLSFGGHAMAAGVTLKEEDLPTFIAAFETVMSEAIQREKSQSERDDILLPVLETDGALSDEFLTYDVANTLKLALPWGAGFPEPLFDDRFKVIKQTLIGKDKNHLKFLLSTAEGRCVDALLFNCDLTQWPDQSVNFIHISYRLEPNQFKDRESVTLLIQTIEIIDDEEQGATSYGTQ